jgi:hypothetical protein
MELVNDARTRHVDEAAQMEGSPPLPPSVAMHSTWNAEVAVPNTNPLGNSAWLSLPVLTAARAHHKLSSSSGTTTSDIS